MLIGAIMVAVTNIAKFLGHPIKFARNRQDKIINERAKEVLINTLKDNEEKIEAEIINLIKKELPDICNVSYTMTEEILPTLQEIKEINLDQNNRIEVLFDSSKDVLREKIMGIYHKNKANKTLKIYEKEALDQYYKDYKKEEWGGCDLVIVSNQRYKDRKDSYDKWEKQIDHKVYELYGLTPEEVAIVEGK